MKYRSEVRAWRASSTGLDDVTAVQSGACLAIWATSDTGSWFGADRAGKRGRSSEQIGRFVTTTFVEDVRSGATVDRHLADQLALFYVLARGRSDYIVPGRSAHLESNLWLAGLFGADLRDDDRRVQIGGIGLTR